MRERLGCRHRPMRPEIGARREVLLAGFSGWGVIAGTAGKELVADEDDREVAEAESDGPEEGKGEGVM